MTVTLASQQAADKILQPVVDPIRSLRAAADRPPEERTPAVTDALSALARSGMDAATETIARDFIKRGRLLQPLTSFDRIVREARAESGQKGDSERKSASTELVEIACERYEFGLGDGGETFAVAKTGPRIALLLRGGRTSLRGQLARDYFARTGRAAAQQALTDALMVIEGMAQEEDESRLYLQTAKAGGAIWLDLGDQAGRAVRITASGWGIEQSAPVLFKRTALNGPLPRSGAWRLPEQAVALAERGQERPAAGCSMARRGVLPRHPAPGARHLRGAGDGESDSGEGARHAA